MDQLEAHQRAQNTPGRSFGEAQPCPKGRPAADPLPAFLGRAVV
jgi:hypothetical protein